jgi:hypothetical protein
MRAPRYPASGDCIHEDPLAIITVAGRTFSVYPSEGIESNGLVSSDQNGLIFYDNDQERFLHRPVFTDILSKHPTPKQMAIINEFACISTWKALQSFFIKIDKILIGDQFMRYQSDPDADRAKRQFLTRAEIFCKEEGIYLTPEELSGQSGLNKLISAISTMPILKRGPFCDVIPDIHKEHPDPSLAKSEETQRVERWLVVNREGLPEHIKSQSPERLDEKQKKLLVQDIVAKYMNDVENWEGSPLLMLKKTSMSRRDLEDYLTGSQTAYCPSPMGFTPRLRHSFAAPQSLADEPREVQIVFMSRLEDAISSLVGFTIKIYYLKEQHCFILDSISSGGRDIGMAYNDNADFERGVLMASNVDLADMVRAVDAVKDATVPEQAERDVQEAKEFIDSMYDESPDNTPEMESEGGNEPEADEEMSERQEM